MTSTEEITVIVVGEKECEEMPQNTEMSDNISEQQDIPKVHTLNCLQTYMNWMLVSDYTLLFWPYQEETYV